MRMFGWGIDRGPEYPAPGAPAQSLPLYQWREQRSEESFLFFDRTTDVTDSSRYTEAFELLNSPSGI